MGVNDNMEANVLAELQVYRKIFKDVEPSVTIDSFEVGFHYSDVI